MQAPRLEDYCVSQTRGFVPDEDPLLSLPSYYEPWTSLADQIPSLLQNSSTLRSRVLELPLLDHTQLTRPAELQRANSVLAVIAHAYVWCKGDAGAPKALPSCVAIPWASVAKSLGLPPIMTHSSTTLFNWKRVDPTGPVELSNLKLVNSITDTEDEEWFFLVPIQMEIEAGSGIKAAVDAQTAVLKDDLCTVAKCLNTMADSLRSMMDAFQRIYEKCRSDVFYNVLRPYLSGWKGNAVYPEGLIYEGVWDEPRQLNGASAAQSATLPCFSAALGIDYCTGEEDGDHAAFLDDMRLFMPKEHREFLVAVANGPSIRDYIQSSGDRNLRQAYNGVLEALVDFRSYHIQIVTSYILLQTRKCVSQDHESIAEKGTGGTGIMPFLKFTRDRVTKYKL
eukprot:m.310522 g.310522  ORF g.310522 m.310522 type:complete len:394 (+) comp52197_c0_seq1:51-1232(+)